MITVYEKIQRYKSKSPYTLHFYARKVNYNSILQAREMPLTKQRIEGFEGLPFFVEIVTFVKVLSIEDNR